MRGSKAVTASEMFVWLGLYVVVLLAAVAVVFLAKVPRPWPSLVMLVPLLPALGLIRWEARALRQLDEMQLHNQIAALAATFAISGVLMAAYALLEAVGWPRLPMWGIFLAMMLIRSACSLTQHFRYR
jgi:hypothetical protein